MFFRSGLVCKVTGQEGSPSTTKLKAGVFDFSVQRLSVLLVVPSLSRRHREGQFNQTTQSGISVCVCCICQGATCTSQGLMRVTSAAVVQIQRVSQHGSRRQNRRRGSRRQVLLRDSQSTAQRPSTTGLTLSRNPRARFGNTAHRQDPGNADGLMGLSHLEDG